MKTNDRNRGNPVASFKGAECPNLAKTLSGVTRQGYSLYFRLPTWDLEGLAGISSRSRHQPQRAWSSRYNNPMHPETRERDYNAAFLHQDRVRSRGGCDEEVGGENQWYSSCTVGSGELLRKLLKRMEPTSGLEPLTCRLRIGCSTN